MRLTDRTAKPMSQSNFYEYVDSSKDLLFGVR